MTVRLGRMENPEIRNSQPEMKMETETEHQNWNSNWGKLRNTETSSIVKSFSIYNYKSPKHNITVCVENYG